VSTLYGIRKTKAKVEQLVDEGYETLLDLPRSFAVTGPGRRQLRSVGGVA
jgi:hypothetical protein